MSGPQTELQAVWIGLLDTIGVARDRLDEESLEELIALLTVLVARLNAERLQREWRRAA